jgi:hypothetical protein
VQVGAADAARLDFDDDAVRRTDGIGDGFGSNIVCAMQDCCFHVTLRKVILKIYFKEYFPCQAVIGRKMTRRGRGAAP